MVQLHLYAQFPPLPPPFDSHFGSPLIGWHGVGGVVVSNTPDKWCWTIVWCKILAKVTVCEVFFRWCQASGPEVLHILSWRRNSCGTDLNSLNELFFYFSWQGTLRMVWWHVIHPCLVPSTVPSFFSPPLPPPYFILDHKVLVENG